MVLDYAGHGFGHALLNWPEIRIFSIEQQILEKMACLEVRKMLVAQKGRL